MSEPHLDSVTLSTLKSIMLDEFGVLLSTFFNDSQGRLDLLDEALLAGDAQALRRTAHSFKGSSSNMGAVRLAALCYQVELLARDGQLDAASALVEAIRAEFALVRNELARKQPVD